ncbi:hypothetical protein RBB50_009976 [Rhinocladiella similis]
MSQTCLSNQPDLKIVNYKPGLGTQRLSKEELTEIEPLVRTLHEQEKTREVIRAECSALIQKRITLSQLDTIRQRLELAVYNKSKASNSIKIQTDGLEMVPGFGDNVQCAEASRDDIGAIMAMEEDMPWSSSTKSTPSHTQDVSLDNFARWRVGLKSFEDTFMPDAEQSHGPREDLESSLAISGPKQLLKALDKAKAAIIRDSDGDVESASQLFAETCGLLENVARMTPDPDDKEKLSSIISVYTTRAKEISSMYSRGIFQTELTNIHAAIPALPRSLNDIFLSYEASQPSSKLYQDTLRQTKDEEDAMIRLNHVAALLHTMKAPEAAFDVFYSIYTHFRKQGGRKPSGLIHEILSAIGCTRSARKITQFETSMAMLKAVCHELLASNGWRYLEATRTWKLLDTLTLYSEQPLILESFKNKEFMTFYTMLPVYPFGEKITSFEQLEILLVALEWERDLNLMQKLQSCPSIKISILRALEVTRLYLNTRPDIFNNLLRDRWDCLTPPAARMLSYLVFEDKAFQAAFQDKSNQDKSNQDKSNQDKSSPKSFESAFILEEQAIAFVPFLLVERIIHDEFSGVDGAVIRSAKRSSPSSTLLRTLYKVSESMKSDIGYAAVIDSYITHISQAEMTPSTSIQTIPEDQLIEIAGITMHAISPTDLWLRTMDDSQTELPGSAMEVDTESICGTVAQSLTSSNSSNFRSFKSVGNRAKRLAASIGIRA